MKYNVEFWHLLSWRLLRPAYVNFLKTQMSKSPKATRNHDLTKLLIFLSLRAIQFRPFQYDTTCNYQSKWASISQKMHLPSGLLDKMHRREMRLSRCLFAQPFSANIIKEWYYISTIVLTYSQKKMLIDKEKLMQICRR